MDSKDEKHGLLAYEDQPSTGFVENPDSQPTINKPRPFRLRIWSLGFTAFLAVTTFALWSSSSPKHCHKVVPFKGIEDRVHKILSETPLIDGHNDLPILVRAVYGNKIYSSDFIKRFAFGNLTGHVDAPRLADGQVGGTFWSVFVPCPADGLDFSKQNYAESVRTTYEQVDVMTRIQEEFKGILSASPNGTTALDEFRRGKVISPLGIEGLHSIGNSLTHLRAFYKLGVRYATLTHNCHNIYADAALVEIPGGGIKKADPVWDGVSEQGKILVSEMNRLGMIVDLAHVSEATMRDVLGAGKDDWIGSQAPVIFSHSSTHALCPHPRNPTDEILKLVKKTDSVVMVNFYPQFISCTASDREDGLPDFYPPNATLSHVANHIMHIGNLIGFDYVGLGSDFDGIESTPKGLEDVSKYPDLIAELLRRGVSDADAAKVAGGNLLRVWKKVDEVALKLQTEGALPAEDDIPPFGPDGIIV
ncbi:membrane dipeptidase GliJ [Talaromyces stipitatus ATCC 10500]|uniref:Dipeptidase n=1 Tax=Talaromyces stipitatus (strain ATCC 10500 / CBS 375.48 / QM 6759 / NRRL 1006) TaxID=441959 RepID=B8MEQ4_TALSN|nr:membrane dipeptidase GliJ [Talaromyces stipitatus ATCC 10500]EED16937.1 membrane dipeptidase GliJ [Talaromyces stipitatus ATCC 10500]